MARCTCLCKEWRADAEKHRLAVLLSATWRRYGVTTALPYQTSHPFIWVWLICLLNWCLLFISPWCFSVVRASFLKITRLNKAQINPQTHIEYMCMYVDMHVSLRHCVNIQYYLLYFLYTFPNPAPPSLPDQQLQENTAQQTWRMSLGGEKEKEKLQTKSWKYTANYKLQQQQPLFGLECQFFHTSNKQVIVKNQDLSD